MTPPVARPAPLWRRLVAALSLLTLAASATGAAEDAPPRGEGPAFHRVFVPEGRLDEVPLGPHRLVPVPLEEFEAAAGGTDGDGPVARSCDVVRYAARPGPDGRLEGTVETEVGAGMAPIELSLGRLPVGRGTVTAEGVTSEATPFARGPGRLAAVAARPGRYRFPWSIEPSGGDGAWSLALVPAVRSIVEITLPSGTVPEVAGQPWVARPVALDAAPGRGATDTPAETTWRIDVGPIGEIHLRAVPPRDSVTSFACWQTARVGLGESRVAALLVPASPWRDRTVVLEAEASLVVERVSLATDDGSGSRGAAEWEDAEGVRRLRVHLPEQSRGTLEAIVVRAAAPFPAGVRGEAGHAPAALPLLWPEKNAWAGGGVRVEGDAGLALVDVEIDGGVAVGDAIAAAWPLPAETTRVAETTVPTVHVEAQGPGTTVRVEVLPDVPDLDVARVTTVEVTTAGVVGRAACDLRVRRGSAFDIAGRIGEGWFIDAVEAFERGAEGDAPAVPEPIEWRVARDARGAVLRVELPTAATPRRGLGLRIVGHRAGVDTDVPFPCRDLEMVRLDGESEGMAGLALVSSPETTIETSGGAGARGAPPDASTPRLAALMPTSAVRAWIPAESVTLAGTAVLLERRAAVEGTTRVVLTARDDRVSQAFTFACRPGTAALDAMVVHFSEPTDDALEWSLLPPADSALTVRRLETPAGRGAAGESWLVEFQPPLRSEAGIRAVRTAPFTGPQRVPLAWIEGSGREDGRVAVVNAGRRRPWILNHRLAEIPPATAAADEPPQKGTLAEFAYDATLAAGEPAAELLPGRRDRDEDARAWAWREETTCWCHPSGSTEYETRFDVENHGRSRVTLTLPPTAVARGVVIDGVTVPSTSQARGGALVVDLPADRRFVRVLVRSEIGVAVGRGAWRVALSTTGIDMPVLERAWEVLLPDGVELLSASGGLREVASGAPGWLERLLPVSVRARDGATAGLTVPRGRRATVDAGFRQRAFVQPATSMEPAILLVQSRWLWGATLLVCLTLVAFGVSVRRRMARLAVAVAMAVAAQWIPVPFDGLARAGLWGLAAAALVRWALGQWRLTRGLALVTALAIAGVAGAAPPEGAPLEAASDGSWPVYVITPAAPAGKEGEAPAGRTALVPEPLLEALSRAAVDRSGEGVRVVGTRLDADPSSDAWRLAVDVDVDAGSLLSLRQAGDAVFAAGRTTVDGAPVRLSADSGPRLLRVGFPTAGRHRVEVGLEIDPVRGGDVASARVSLPVAPRSDVAVAGAPARGAPSTVHVEVPDDAGIPRPARPLEREGTAATFDAGRAAWVRVVWAVDGRTPLADVLPVVDSVNVLSWRDGGCTLAASYRIDGVNQIVRGVVVRADPRLGPARVADPSLAVTPLGGGRWSVAPAAPRRGAWGFEASFTMPVADPVGSFEVPGAWLESAVADTRSVQIVAAADLVLRAAPPEDAVPLPPRPDGPAAAWRIEAGRAARTPEGEAKGTSQAPGKRGGAGTGRIAVERRRPQPRGTQRVDLEYARDRVRARLRARIDSLGSALVAVPIEIPAAGEVERATLREEKGPAGPEASGERIDLRWHRAGPDRIVAVLQRPREGAFTLDVVVTIPGPPARVGPLPLVRARIEQGGATTVTWTTADGAGLRVPDADGSVPEADGSGFAAAAAAGSIDVAADAPPPSVLWVERVAAGTPDSERPDERAVTPAAPETAPAAPAAGAIEPRVELAETHLTIDAKGRAWGVTQIDLVAVRPWVRLRLPAGMRLFEVFVDGRVANDAIPASDAGADGSETWELRLLDVGWPRSVVAVFAGELPGGAPRGADVEIAAPRIEGMPCRRRAWVVELPEGFVARPVPPARAVDGGKLAEERIAALDRLAPIFDAAIARSSVDDGRRLEDFRRERRREAALPVPPAWEQASLRASRSGGAWAAPVSAIETVDAADPGTLRLAIDRRADESFGGRVWATVALVVGWSLLLELRRRTPTVSRAAAVLASNRWAAPAVTLALGAAWVGNLDPAWPGWLAIAGGASALAAWGLRPPGRSRRRAATPGRFAEEATHAARSRQPADRGHAPPAWRAGQEGVSGSTRGPRR